MLINGFDSNAIMPKNYRLSEDDKIYFWDMGKDRETENDCIERAYYNAVNCASVQNSQGGCVVVICFEIPKKMLMKDNSGDDCKFEPRNCLDRTTLYDGIKSNKIRFYGEPKFLAYTPQYRYEYMYPNWLYDQIDVSPEEEIILSNMRDELVKNTGCSECYFTEHTKFGEDKLKYDKQ